ncbi:MAG: class I SAM-dependent methyltransferase [candidate division WOR-3 bacterium]|nr:class I SAM-dependent methyltransferase [candidate division WOR-3 bacterium]
MRLGTLYRYRLLGFLGLWDEVRATDDVLDVGGFDGFVLSRIGCRSKTLVDPDAQSVFEGIEYVKADFLTHDFGGRRFDRIFSLDVIEHIPAGTEQRYFGRISSLLKDGATAYVTTPSSDIRVFPNFLRGWVARKWAHYKCFGYSKSELRTFLQDTELDCNMNELNAPMYLFWYLPVRALQPFMPARLLNCILTRLATFDARHARGMRGYFLLRLRRRAGAPAGGRQPNSGSATLTAEP